jgi:hypothetical protein
MMIFTVVGLAAMPASAHTNPTIPSAPGSVEQVEPYSVAQCVSYLIGRDYRINELILTGCEAGASGNFAIRLLCPVYLREGGVNDATDRDVACFAARA